eukprot:COSAG05_NODE_1300_length_5243_cov_15.420101_2_plen_80_part_00
MRGSSRTDLAWRGEHTFGGLASSFSSCAAASSDAACAATISAESCGSRGTHASDDVSNPPRADGDVAPPSCGVIVIRQQ